MLFIDLTPELLAMIGVEIMYKHVRAFGPETPLSALQSDFDSPILKMHGY
jgi:hypothetical protein